MEPKTNPFSLKFSLVIFPYMVSALALTVLYTFLNWLIFIKLRVNTLQDITDIYLPLALICILHQLYLKPRIRLLRLKLDKGNLYLTYLVIAFILLILPVVASQKYIARAAEKLKKLESISQLSDSDNSRYYTINKAYFDKKGATEVLNVSSSGKFHRDLDAHLYIVCPIADDSVSNTRQTTKAWLAVEYGDYIRMAAVSPERKKLARDSFVKECWKAFQKQSLPTYTYMERLGTEASTETYLAAIKKSPLYTANQHVSIFQAKTGDFNSRTAGKLTLIILAFIFGFFWWCVLILLTPFNNDALAAYIENKG